MISFSVSLIFKLFYYKIYIILLNAKFLSKLTETPASPLFYCEHPFRSYFPHLTKGDYEIMKRTNLISINRKTKIKKGNEFHSDGDDNDDFKDLPSDVKVT